MKTRFPLENGSRIGVFAPSGVFDDKRLEKSCDLIRSWGFEPVFSEGLHNKHRYLAGNDQQRLESLIWALSDPTLDAAWMVRGGFGLTRIIHSIPWTKLVDRPVIGFSDGTALTQAMQIAGFTWPIHGPVLQSLADHVDEQTQNAIKRLLKGELKGTFKGAILKTGTASGKLVGGNLCVLNHLCGTRSQLDANNSILILEDVQEPAYKLDRMLTQLISAGCLNGVRGIGLGSFNTCSDGQKSLTTEILLEHFEPLKVPILENLPIGHETQNFPFVIGADATISGDTLKWSK